jgi:SAM-dependent methyltransferase
MKISTVCIIICLFIARIFAQEPEFYAKSPLKNSDNSLPEESKTAEETFTLIYENKVWNVNEENEGFSGPGSTLANTKEYRKFLQKFLKEHNIRSVTDVGCGDWTFSKAIDWTGIQYTGYDVVKSIIDKDISRYGKNNIHFVHCNAINMDLPPTDLLICKDVLQHLPNEEISLFLKQLPKFKYALITNGVDFSTNSRTNIQIVRGCYRPLDLTKPPFSIKGEKILAYQSGNFLMQVLLCENK